MCYAENVAGREIRGLAGISQRTVHQVHWQCQPPDCAQDGTPFITVTDQACTVHTSAQLCTAGRAVDCAFNKVSTLRHVVSRASHRSDV